MTRLRFIVPLALLLFVAPACDSAGGDDGQEAGTFDVTISGAVSQKAEGLAAFGAGRDAQTGNQGFAINLQTQGGQQIVLTLFNQPRPGTGSYTVARFGPGVSAGSIPQGQFVAVLSVGSDVYNSVSGTIRLTTSQTDRVAGEVDFRATSLLSTGEITVKGSFNAIGRDVGTQ